MEEDFGAQPLPSREACLRAVHESDVYLLLFGPCYGHIFPETGQSATHDEFVAAQAKGMPRVVLKKTGVVFESEQDAFIRLVGDYGTGVFYDTFSDAIQAKVVRALRQVRLAPSGTFSLWYTLPRTRMALGVLDPDHLTARITDALRLVGRLRVLNTRHVAVAVGIDPASLTTVGRISQLATQTSAMFAGGGRLERVYSEPDEAATTAALDRCAEEVARPLARRLIDAVT